MSTLYPSSLEAALDDLPIRFAGPGGLAGVVHEGRIVATRAWGYANLGTGAPLGRETLFPICSVSKQFTCAAILGEFGEAGRLDGHLAALLPAFTGVLPTSRHLADNQSGLRDYWAMTTLLGAAPGQSFSREEGIALLASTRTGHFAPGTSYSYSNGNFRLLAEMAEHASGADMEQLYARHVWRPAGMQSACLVPDTGRIAEHVTGYEGGELAGYIPAQNNIYWLGDAGICACLDDMLAYEQWIDATRDEPQGLYRLLSRPPRFADGSEASYGHGLMFDRIGGLEATGHTGALRGFRCCRLHLATERLSVVVMFNHEANARAAAVALISAALGRQEAAPAPVAADGLWLDRERGLVARLHKGALHYLTTAQQAGLSADDRIEAGPAMLDLARLRLSLPAENACQSLEPLSQDRASGADADGVYRCDETGSAMVVETRDGATYARFEGPLGRGPMEQVRTVAPDILQISSRRALDAPAPGNWTLILRRSRGRVVGGRLGCWLARGLDYRRV